MARRFFVKSPVSIHGIGLTRHKWQGGDAMYWLLARPAIGWGAFLLIHAIGIPFVYGVGKTCAMKKMQEKKQDPGI